MPGGDRVTTIHVLDPHPAHDRQRFRRGAAVATPQHDFNFLARREELPLDVARRARDLALVVNLCVIFRRVQDQVLARVEPDAVRVVLDPRIRVGVAMRRSLDVRHRKDLARQLLVERAVLDLEPDLDGACVRLDDRHGNRQRVLLEDLVAHHFGAGHPPPQARKGGEAIAVDVAEKGTQPIARRRIRRGKLAGRPQLRQVCEGVE